jgi:hypothetical protein
MNEGESRRSDAMIRGIHHTGSSFGDHVMRFLVISAALVASTVVSCTGTVQSLASAVAPPVRLELREPERRLPGRERTREGRQPGFGYGLTVTGGYAAENELSLYGLSGVVRYSFVPYLSLELDFGLNGGSDDALLVPMSLNGLLFLRLRGQFQPYFIWGANLTVVEQLSGDPTAYFGGAHIGLGVESSFRRRVGLTLDLRTFFQESLAADDDLEYGVTLNYGIVFYRN